VFFTAVQLLTISSAITNPLTAGGKIVDVALAKWAIFVVTSIAGSFTSFLTPATPVRRDRWMAGSRNPDASAWLLPSR
jgi:hypothetical protein